MNSTRPDSSPDNPVTARNAASLILPVPLNLIPLPVKWKIVFLPQIKLPYRPEAAEDAELIAELSSEIREEMQESLSALVAQR